MKYHFLALLICSFAILSGAEKNKIKEIHSVKDFEKLYKKKVYPFNKLSDTTFYSLKSNMVFDEQDRFRGFNYISGLWKELTYEENLEFDRYFGVPPVYNEEEKARYEILRNRK